MQLLRILGSCLGLLLWAECSLAKDMSFDVRRTPLTSGKTFYSIYADGSIVQGTSSKLEAILAEMRRDPGSSGSIFLNSPGGLVVESLRMARSIRNAGLMTNVLKQSDIGSGMFITQPANCMSACIFAFLGGVTRRVPERSAIGVHQFSMKADGEVDARSAVSSSQVLSAAIIDLMMSAGVDTRLFQLISAVPPDDLFIIPAEILVKYRVVGDPKLKESVYFDLIGATTWLHLERNSSAGDSILSLRCVNGSLDAVLMFPYDDVPGLGNPGLLIDGKRFEIPAGDAGAKTQVFENWKVVSSFAVPRSMADMLARAKSVGGYLKAPPNRLVYHDYYLEFEIQTAGTNKVSTLIESCAARR